MNPLSRAVLSRLRVLSGEVHALVGGDVKLARQNDRILSVSTAALHN